MVFDDGEEVDADGVEEEHFLLKFGVVVVVWRRRGERGGEGRNAGVARGGVWRGGRKRFWNWRGQGIGGFWSEEERGKEGKEKNGG